MRLLASKVATFLLAPLILGASCLSCLVQAIPASAATVQMDRMEQDCADYKAPLSQKQKTVETSTIQTQVPVLALAYGGSAHAGHDANCQAATNGAVLDNFQKTDLSITNGSSPVVSPVIFSVDTKTTPRFFDYQQTINQNNHFLVGIVVKRE